VKNRLQSSPFKCNLQRYTMASRSQQTQAAQATQRAADPTQALIDGFTGGGGGTQTQTQTQGGRGGGGGGSGGGGGQRRQRFHDFDASKFYHTLLTCAADDDDGGGGGGGGGHELVTCSSARRVTIVHFISFNSAVSATTAETTSIRQLSLSSQAITWTIASPCLSDRIESLTLAFRKKSKKRRRVRATTLRFGAGEGQAIAVGLYAHISEAKKPKEVKLHKRDLSEVGGCVQAESMLPKA
jgi:hypothetical protein